MTFVIKENECKKDFPPHDLGESSYAKATGLQLSEIIPWFLNPDLHVATSPLAGIVS